MKTAIYFGISLILIGCSSGPSPYANLACQRQCRSEGKVNDPDRTTEKQCVCKERK